jgi:hypothetical protein
MIEAQKAGKAQLVVYGPFSYQIAVNQGIKIQNVGLITSAARPRPRPPGARARLRPGLPVPPGLSRHHRGLAHDHGILTAY